MSYADPQTITIDGVTSSLPRVSVGDGKSIYRSNNGLVTLSASHQYGKRTRRVLRVDVENLGVSDIYTGLGKDESMSCYLVFDLPKYSTYFTPATAKFVFDGFNTQLHASSDALITKLLGGES
jgi:hypothetical protein